MLYLWLADKAIRYPRGILITWLVCLSWFAAHASDLPAVLHDHGLRTQGSYNDVQHVLSEDFGIPEDPVIVLFDVQKKVSSDEFQSYLEQRLHVAASIQGVKKIISPVNRPEMRKANFAYALIEFSQPSGEMEGALKELRQVFPPQEGIGVRLTGSKVVQTDVNAASRTDLGKAESLGIPIAFIIMWLAFGSVWAALLPVWMGVISVAGAMGFMAELGKHAELSSFVLNVIPMVGLALSIDFALMMVSRFREELHRRSAGDALRITMETAGRAVVLSAACVALGLAGIAFIPMPIFASVAWGAMVVLLLSVLLTLTLLPVILYRLSERLRAPRYPMKTAGIWRWSAHAVMRRPGTVIMFGSGLLLVCLLPLNDMRIAIPDASSLPSEYASRQAFEDWEEVFQTHSANNETPVNQVWAIIGKDNRQLTRQDLGHIRTVIKVLTSDPQVIHVQSVFSRQGLPVQALLRKDSTVLKVTLKGSPSDAAVQTWMTRWEQLQLPEPLTILWGGEAKYQQEVFETLRKSMPGALIFIVLSNFIVLYIAFRSFLIPLKALLMNALSIGAAYGVLVMVSPWISGESHEAVAVMIPIFIFGLVFGISMDYGVFLLSRIAEHYRLTGDNEQAVAEGLASAGGIITSAALIMMAVTAPFAAGDVAGVRQLGIGIAAAVFIDATIIRLLLIPSLMKWLGPWNWRGI
ncbi:hypothetical protein SY83_22375 [Paenibacillus swuensis]|uniref:SSD domain-containing protein n=1 Tax=Paenibacillus swuensis TaxID=1178515 RepID=A0A172TP37_9BACL|nr:efflux RND transporter permease subunit [Paenibacillus swuensis]ANE48577.1 hypothetical protein SY83_22375 [Paenibacillus swuensis]